MFESSFLNGIEIGCWDHPHSPVLHLCTDYKCNENPFICAECKAMQKHYGHETKIRQLMSGVKQLSDSLSRTRKPIEMMYNKVASDKQNDSLMKYQEEREQHCQSIRKHVESIRFQIDQQFHSILKAFEKELEKQKQVMYAELEKYYESYRDKFEYLARKIGPIALVNNSFKYYSNKSNLLLKLLAESDAGNSIKWMNELKRTCRAAEALIGEPQVQIQKIRSLSSQTNQLMDRLPRVRGPDYETQLPRVLNACAKEALWQFVRFGERANSVPTTVGSISRSYSAQAELSYQGRYYDGPQ